MKYLFFICLVVLSSRGLAAKKYVSDVLYIPIRTGPSTEHKILGYLKSGTKVATLGSQGEYMHVKPEDAEKKQGWVKTRFLLDSPIAAMKLEGLQEDLSQIEAIKNELKKYKTESQKFKADRDLLAKRLERIEKASASAIQIDQKNQELVSELDNLSNELKNIKESNMLLEQNQRNEGIKLGILAIALGALVGFILPYMKPRGRRKHTAVRLR